MKRSAWRRILRNCHHFRKMRYQETTEKTTRIASTNFVSRLEVSTSSQGVVGTARPTCSSSTRQPSPQESGRSEEHTSELQSRLHLVCRLLLEKKKKRHRDKFCATSNVGFAKLLLIR